MNKRNNAAIACMAAAISLLIAAIGSGAAVLSYHIFTPASSYSEPAGSDPASEPDPVSRPVDEYAPTVELQAARRTEPALSESEIAARLAPSVVGIVTHTAGTPIGEGSGVVLNADGYILTNAHVVSTGDGILVVDSESRVYHAERVGEDERTDLAVIRILESVTMTPAEFAESESASVGDAVVAIGNPGGISYAGSSTYGRISAVNRSISTSVNILGVLQVDAAINPGNSGGALVNQWGQVIGINCAKVVADQFEGIGFAIPMSKARPIFDSLMKYGYFHDRITLGITFHSVDSITAALNGTAAGVRISTMDKVNAFRGTDVQAGDYLTAVNGAPITDNAVLFDALYGAVPGDPMTFSVYRPNGDRTFDVTVTLPGEYR